MITITPDDGIVFRNIYIYVNILSTTPLFYFVIPPTVTELVWMGHFESPFILYRFGAFKFSSLHLPEDPYGWKKNLFFVILDLVNPDFIIIVYHLELTPNSCEFM
jgi:hypothetical protein